MQCLVLDSSRASFYLGYPERRVSRCQPMPAAGHHERCVPRYQRDTFPRTRVSPQDSLPTCRITPGEHPWEEIQIPRIEADEGYRRAKRRKYIAFICSIIIAVFPVIVLVKWR